jgi:hypothetical protein
MIFDSVFTTACAAAQISFYVETGGEIQWMAASRVVGGTGGMGLLLSGLPAMIIAFMVLYAIALVISPRFYDAVDHILGVVGSSFRQSLSLITKKRNTPEEHELLISFQEEQPLSPVSEANYETELSTTKRPLSTVVALVISIMTIGASMVVVLLQILRPTTPPYAHMSGSLPVTLIEAVLFQPINSEFCLPHPVEAVVFPFERFTKYFDVPQSLDWIPRAMNCSKNNGPRPPPWVTHPEVGGPGEHDSPAGGSEAPWPPGHHGPPRPGHHGPPGTGHHGPPEPGHHGPPRPYEHDNNRGPLTTRSFPEPALDHEPVNFADEYAPYHHGEGWFGGSECEPLRLSNLNASIVEILAGEIKTKKPKIKNVLLLTLESTRKDMFPLKKGSHAHKIILDTYDSTNATSELDAKLRGFTDTAAFLSGQPSGFGTRDGDLPGTKWRSSFKDGMGAININGAISQAAYTLKSLLSSHCGVEPLAVDFAEETRGRIYQHCLPHIFAKMTSTILSDSAKANEGKDHRSWPWESAMIQSVTDQYDSQDVLDAQMGFKNVIAESTLSDPSSKHYPPKRPFVNYFGYAETETLDYLRDLFVDAQGSEKRLFVSHLTSTPHHPFKTPKDWPGKKAYMKQQRWRPADPVEDYLNTIQYQDEWISQIFEMLHDVGALEETLVVMTGDHGLAFSSLDNSQSAIANGHVSNFQIPILFVHPDLPRIQINASTTPTSILPTVLDLLLQSDSLSESSAKIASDILPSYQGNSLIRNLDFSIKTAHETSPANAFFQPFHFSAINPGGSLLAISDAGSTFRLILPLCSTIALRFTDISVDPYELDPLTAWTMDELRAQIKVRYGTRASSWAELAGDLGRWWVWNQREKWGYWGNAKETSRGGAEVGGGRGRIKKQHWWETK